MAMISAKAMAALISESLDEDVSAKRLRSFVRSYIKRNGGAVGVDTPGRGGSYAFDEDEMHIIRDAFVSWRTTRTGMHVSFRIDGEDAE